MAHFYRGELGRIMVWRTRLDTTTNWAIVATTGIITVAWSESTMSNFLFIFSNVALYLLLTIEARRYRFYDAYRARVRILESHFIFPVLTQTEKRLEGNWRKMLGTDLLIPTFKITYWEALSRRFNRNYVWLFIITMGTWVMHILYHSPDVNTVGQFYERLADNLPIPAWLFLMMVAAFYIYLIVIGMLGLKTRKASGEFLKRPNAGERVEGNWSI